MQGLNRDRHERLPEPLFTRDDLSVVEIEKLGEFWDKMRFKSFALMVPCLLLTFGVSAGLGAKRITVDNGAPVVIVAGLIGMVAGAVGFLYHKKGAYVELRKELYQRIQSDSRGGSAESTYCQNAKEMADEYVIGIGEKALNGVLSWSDLGKVRWLDRVVEFIKSRSSETPPSRLSVWYVQFWRRY